MFRDQIVRFSYLLLTLALIFVQIPKNLYHSCDSQHEVVCDHSESNENETYSTVDNDCLVCSFDSCFEAVMHYSWWKESIISLDQRIVFIESSPELSEIRFKQLRAPPVTLS